MDVSGQLHYFVALPQGSSNKTPSRQNKNTHTTDRQYNWTIGKINVVLSSFCILYVQCLQAYKWRMTC